MTNSTPVKPVLLGTGPLATRQPELTQFLSKLLKLKDHVLGPAPYPEKSLLTLWTSDCNL